MNCAPLRKSWWMCCSPSWYLEHTQKNKSVLWETSAEFRQEKNSSSCVFWSYNTKQIHNITIIIKCLEESVALPIAHIRLNPSSVQLQCPSIVHLHKLQVLIKWYKWKIEDCLYQWISVNILQQLCSNVIYNYSLSLGVVLYCGKSVWLTRVRCRDEVGGVKVEGGVGWEWRRETVCVWRRLRGDMGAWLWRRSGKCEFESVRMERRMTA